MDAVVITIIFMAVVFFFWCLDIKWIKNKFSPIKEVKSEVIKKEVENVLVQRKFEMLLSKPKERYVITFLCDSKKRRFCVPERAYDNYRVGDCGILKYKGDVILDFDKNEDF